MIRCVMGDLDGTIVYKNVLSELSRKAIELLEENGINFIVVTGRGPGHMSEFLDALGHSCNRVTLNGGNYINSNDEVIFENYFEKDKLKECVDILEKHGLPATYYVGDKIYSTNSQEENIAASKPAMIDLGFPEDMDYGADFVQTTAEEILKMDVLKIEIMHYREDLREALRDELKTVKDVNLSQAFPTNIEINPLSSNKAIGVRRVCELYGYAPDEVACFGDSENDIPMLSQFPHSYAMGNATPATKASANYVIGDCADDGFYYQVLEIIREHNQELTK